MKASELRSNKLGELNEELVELRREQFNLRMQQGVGQAPRPDRIRKVRRDIARVKTVINEKLAQGESA
ncbi:MAG: 50S ribosomal protein L29 [Halofilum sp. (in: g-proteobacteria)]|nr:50S ribosomal protein L29 [Halofilum sp. (in: g-proteobacteria)]